MLQRHSNRLIGGVFADSQTWLQPTSNTTSVLDKICTNSENVFVSVGGGLLLCLQVPRLLLWGQAAIVLPD